MMHIERSAKDAPHYRKECERCGCRFTFQVADTTGTSYPNVTCPDCGGEVETWGSLMGWLWRIWHKVRRKVRASVESEKPTGQITEGVPRQSSRMGA